MHAPSASAPAAGPQRLWCYLAALALRASTSRGPDDALPPLLRYEPPGDREGGACDEQGVDDAQHDAKVPGSVVEVVLLGYRVLRPVHQRGISSALGEVCRLRQLYGLSEVRVRSAADGPPHAWPHDIFRLQDSQRAPHVEVPGIIAMELGTRCAAVHANSPVEDLATAVHRAVNNGRDAVHVPGPPGLVANGTAWVEHGVLREEEHAAVRKGATSLRCCNICVRPHVAVLPVVAKEVEVQEEANHEGDERAHQVQGTYPPQPRPVLAHRLFGGEHAAHHRGNHEDDEGHCS
mmetsp:Transcript_61459/g.193747  ORF Transcript_61459/g.193747 Transcript_61459/m.193747 type:complete len:292 (+) Transcript_61459:56-931(+)